MTELSTWYQVYLLIKNGLQQVSIFIIIKESVNKARLSGKHLTLSPSIKPSLTILLAQEKLLTENIVE